MVEQCAYTKLGMAIDLLSQSKFHNRFAMGLYVHIEILPPLKLDQVWFLTDENHVANAMVTWARVSDVILDDIVATGRSVHEHEWDTGEIIFINDFISPNVPALKIIRMLKDESVFGKTYEFSSFRRHMDASVRKVNRWTNRDVWAKN